MTYVNVKFRHLKQILLRFFFYFKIWILKRIIDTTDIDKNTYHELHDYNNVSWRNLLNIVGWNESETRPCPAADKSSALEITYCIKKRARVAHASFCREVAQGTSPMAPQYAPSLRSRLAPLLLLLQTGFIVIYAFYVEIEKHSFNTDFTSNFYASKDGGWWWLWEGGWCGLKRILFLSFGDAFKENWV